LETGYDMWQSWRESIDEMSGSISEISGMGTSMFDSMFTSITDSLGTFVENWNEQMGTLKYPSIPTEGVKAVGLEMIEKGIPPPTTPAEKRYYYGAQLGGTIPRTGLYLMHAGEEVWNPARSLMAPPAMREERDQPRVFHITVNQYNDHVHTEADMDTMTEYVSKAIRDSIIQLAGR